MEKELQRTSAQQYTWSELRERAQQLPLVANTYQWSKRSEGLIVPSSIAFINYLNALPAKTHHHTTARPQQTGYASPFHTVDQVMAQLSPKRLLQNLRNLRPPRLPAFPFPGQPKPYHGHHSSGMTPPHDAAYYSEPSDLTAASGAMPNSPHSEPATFSSASKMPPAKKVHRTMPQPPPMPQPMNRCV